MSFSYTSGNVILYLVSAIANGKKKIEKSGQFEKLVNFT